MKFRHLVLIFISFFLFASCSKEGKAIQFYYTKNYKNDKWENHRTALLWALSYLGAELPSGSFDKAIKWKDSTIFTFDFSKVGFNETALSAIKVICDSLMSTPHYEKKQSVDIGAFVSLTIGCSEHYYKITGVPSSEKELNKKKLQGELKTFSITKSVVASHHRIIKYTSHTENPLDWLFVAHEGEGDVDKLTFKAEFYEMIDIMPNGQLRFMIFDSDGNRISTSPKKFGNAGKPAKCLWCHEIAIQPLFEKTDSVPNSISPMEFQEDVVRFMTSLKAYRSKLKGDIDFSKTQDHTQMELEYISYMQPSAKKLSVEWAISESEVEHILNRIGSKEHEEFKFLGKVYQRRDLPGLRTVFPQDIREPNHHEINFFK